MTSNDAEIDAVIATLPDADKPGRESKFSGPPWDEALKSAAAVLVGGKESIAALAGAVEDGFGGGPKGFRPGYLLHAIALHASAPDRDAERRLFVEAVASRLGGAAPDAQAFLIRELAAVGGEEVVAVLGKLLADEALADTAAQALVAIGGKSAGTELRSAWRGASARRRTMIVQALGALRDAAATALLREALSDEGPETRLVAAWALARIGDAQSAADLLRLAEGSLGFERAKATQACLLLAETLAAAGKREEARSVYTQLRDSRQDPSEAYVRQAAERGIEAAR
jgi:HEAT repeat protein